MAFAIALWLRLIGSRTRLTANAFQNGIWTGGLFMYIDTYIAIMLWAFAIFGLFYFVLRVYATWDLYRKKKNRAYTLIISARNQEDAIEGLVRGFILKAGLDSTEEKLLQVVLLDLGSTDETARIMRNLSVNYSIVKLVKPDDLTGYLKTLI
jgi:hypothetical protein